MIIATSSYWNVIHGMIPGESVKDDEGNQIMEVLGNNMAWILKMREQTKGIIPTPTPVLKVMTNFIR